MKYIKYKTIGTDTVYNQETDELEKVDAIAEVTMTYSESNEVIAKERAHNGEYTIEDDGQPEPVSEPTTDDVLNALLGVTSNE